MEKNKPVSVEEYNTLMKEIKQLRDVLCECNHNVLSIFNDAMTYDQNVGSTLLDISEDLTVVIAKVNTIIDNAND